MFTILIHAFFFEKSITRPYDSRATVDKVMLCATCLIHLACQLYSHMPIVYIPYFERDAWFDFIVTLIAHIRRRSFTRGRILLSLSLSLSLYLYLSIYLSTIRSLISLLMRVPLVLPQILLWGVHTQLALHAQEIARVRRRQWHVVGPA